MSATRLDRGIVAQRQQVLPPAVGSVRGALQHPWVREKSWVMLEVVVVIVATYTVYAQLEGTNTHSMKMPGIAWL